MRHEQLVAKMRFVDISLGHPQNNSCSTAAVDEAYLS